MESNPKSEAKAAVGDTSPGTNLDQTEGKIEERGE